VDFITDARLIPARCGDEKVEGLPSGVTRILGHGIEQFAGLLGEEFIKYKTGNIEALTDEGFTLTQAGANAVTRSKGNTDSLPVFLLKGIIPSGASTYVSLKTNDEELRVIGVLAAGETLVIDSGLVTAKVVDGTGETLRNGLPLLQELNFPILRKGANSVTITAIGATFTELQIQAKSRWR